MINRDHDLPVAAQCELLEANCSRWLVLRFTTGDDRLIAVTRT
ncbi:hypothetical protein ABH922_005633 [Rhodococcus sp. 27YEA15]